MTGWLVGWLTCWLYAPHSSPYQSNSFSSSMHHQPRHSTTSQFSVCIVRIHRSSRASHQTTPPSHLPLHRLPQARQLSNVQSVMRLCTRCVYMGVYIVNTLAHALGTCDNGGTMVQSVHKCITDCTLVSGRACGSRCSGGCDGGVV